MDEQQLKERESRLGATDISAILGINPKRTAYETWLEKTGRLDPWRGNDATDAGDLLEPAVLDYAEREQGPLARQVVRWAPSTVGCPIASTLDAEVDETGVPVEAKTSGIVGPLYGYWGEQDTDEVPDVYLVQCSIQILCTRADMAYLYALLGGRGFVRYQIRRDESLLRTIVESAQVWWDRHIDRGVEPERTPAPSMDVVKRIRREPNKRIEFGAEALEAVSKWEAAKLVARGFADDVKRLQSAALLHLGDAEGADLGDGRELVYLQQTKREHVVKESTYRVARIRKVK